MIILDTNVLSAFIAERVDPELKRWLDAQVRQSIWTTAVTVLEIQFGIELLPTGRRRSRLQDEFFRALDNDLEGRILNLDREAAAAAALCIARRRAAGRPIGFRDGEIAGIVASRQARLATRNTRDFDDLGIDLMNPWTD